MLWPWESGSDCDFVNGTCSERYEQGYRSPTLKTPSVPRCLTTYFVTDQKLYVPVAFWCHSQDERGRLPRAKGLTQPRDSNPGPMGERNPGKNAKISAYPRRIALLKPSHKRSLTILISASSARTRITNRRSLIKTETSEPRVICWQGCLDHYSLTARLILGLGRPLHVERYAPPESRCWLATIGNS